MLNGWQTRTAQELDQTIRTWGEMFNHYQIPLTAYPQLYQRGFDVRQQKLQTGGDVPQMDATLLVSQWTGEYGLRAELRQREIDAGRTLGANAASVCKHCNGSGFKRVTGFDYQGGYTCVVKCDHRD
jgi:hypothetical protein